MDNQRILTLLEKLEPKSISVFYSGKAPRKSHDQHYLFSANRNFYYLTNINQQHVYLVLIKGVQLEKSYLFIEKVDPQKALWDGATLSFEQALELSKVDEVKDIQSFEPFIASMLSSMRQNIFGILNTLYLDFESQELNQLPTQMTAFAQKVSQTYPFLKIENSHMILAHMRMVKDATELAHIKTALNVTQKAFEHIMHKVKPGMNEYHLQAEYNYILNQHRALPAFDTICASGVNATVLHYIENDHEIKDGDLILFDAGAELSYYNSDITRTFPANGKFTDRQKQIYQIVLKANKETIAWVKPGITLKDFNEFGKRILIEGMKKIGMIEKDEDILRYYYHSLGHGLGLDVHDVADYTKPIMPGHVLTVEPGIYIKEEAIGIRIEDDILITEEGCINLSSGFIKEIKEIENFMKKRG